MRPSLLLTPALLLLLSACGTRPAAPGVQPVAAPPTTVTAADTTAPGRAIPATGSSAGPAPTAGTGADDVRPQVDAALLRYDLALTALAAHPDRAGDPASAERAAWARVVVAGSALDEAMVEEVVRRGVEEDGAVLPPPGGLSYRHVALSARPDGDGSTEFTWCGYSPGVGVERSSGTVVDDAVGHSHGTGRLEVVDGTVRVAQLEQTALDVLPAGTPDPCPGEVRP
jgi:hypothetical protein